MKKRIKISDIDSQLGRRERQILDILYRLGTATAREVQAGLPEPPSYPAVRKWLSLMEQKGLIRHREEGNRYIYEAAISREEARRFAQDRLVDTFFKGSPLHAAAALLADEELQEDEEGVRLLRKLIADARRNND